MNNQATDNGGIIAWFTRNPVAANLIMLLVICLGLLEATDLRREAFPSIEPNEIRVSVSYDSGSAKLSEEGIAIKIEEQLEDVSGIESITSSSSRSGSSVVIEKQDDYELDTLLEDVRAKIDAISTFPAEAKNPVISKAEREEHSLWIQLFGDVDRHSLQQLANELKTDLLDHQDVSRVSISGWLDPMMTIEIDEGKLQSYGLSLSDVENAINNGSNTALTAILRNQSTYLQLQASQQAYMTTDFAALPLVTLANGSQVRLGDVTRITDTFDDDTSSLSRYNQHDSIALQVVTTGQDDIADTVIGAREVIDSWRADGRLPDNIKLTSWYDRSESITQRLDLLVRNAISGIALVFILLALFLNLRVAIWVAAGLPFIFFGTLYFMGDNFMGLTLNEFTTFGFIMALGIVVDDAVVVGESVYAERKKHGDSIGNTIRGTQRVAIPTMFGVFTTVAAFYALSNIDGRLGELYSQFAMIVTICLLLSLVESKLILPAHLSHLKTTPTANPSLPTRRWGQIQAAADAGLQWFNQRVYMRVLDWAIYYRYAIVLLFVALFVAVISMPFNGAVRVSFFPDIVGETVRARITMQNDASFGLTHNNLLRFEDLAYQTDEALAGEDSPGYIGSLQVMSSSDQAGEVTVELSEEAPYDIREFTKHWQTLIGSPEGARSVNVQSSRRMIDAVRIELRAEDEIVLNRAGSMLKEELAAIEGVSGIEDNMAPGQPSLKLKLNQLGRSLGLNTRDLALQVMQSFSGQVVQRYQRNSDEIEVKVRYPEEDRQNPGDVYNARIRTSDGTVVYLSSVATITQGYTQDSVTRIDGKRAVYISADVDKDVISATELVNQLKATTGPMLLRQYPGLDIHYAGEAEQQAETQSSMVSMFMVAMLVIYMLLAIPLKSYIQPVLIMTAIPFGIIGAILGHWLYDLSLGILSLNGIIALSGVVVNDSLLLVSRYNETRQDNAGQTNADHTEAIKEACSNRLRAVILTSLTTYAGLMPLLGETSFQAQFLIPAAISLGYGILFATVITLVLIPVLLCIQRDITLMIDTYGKRLFSRQSGESPAAP